MPTHASVSTRPSFVVRLGAARPDDPDLGGKAASLDRLARLGYPIPPGFCLTAAACRALLASVDDPAALADAIGALPDESARIAIVARLEATPTPVAVTAALRAGLDELQTDLRSLDGAADPPTEATFAVRSSALDEDGVTASFAGVHETELGRVAGEVEAAVRRCWLSLWNPAAISYRTRRTLAFNGLAMAVVVQALVPADVSAVVFTRHPVTGRDDVLINAIRGLGEPMVSGEATPESIVVERASRTIVERTAGDHGRRLFVRAGRPVGEADSSADHVLSDADATELAGIALDVEARTGGPVDIEAARRADRWILLQARPITTK